MKIIPLLIVLIAVVLVAGGSRVVRSDVHPTASHTNWVEVKSGRFPIHLYRS
jgi:hypothetical protein